MITRHDVEQEEQRLREAIEPAVAASEEANLAVVSRLLHQATAGVEALLTDQAVSLTAERRQQYFPPRFPEPTERDLREAETRWQEALERGQRYRTEAQAQVGPLLTPAQTAEWLGVSTVTVNTWRRQGKLLGVRFDDHQYRYPVFQFADSPVQGEQGVLRGLDVVLGALGDRTDWEKALFLLGPLPGLQGRRPLDVLRGGPDPHTVTRLCDLASHAGEKGV